MRYLLFFFTVLSNFSFAAASPEFEVSQQGHHFQVSLSPEKGALIPNIIQAVAAKNDIKSERIFIGWDFDDTLAIQAYSAYLAKIALQACFTNDVSFQQFRHTCMHVFEAAGFITHDREIIAPSLDATIFTAFNEMYQADVYCDFLESSKDHLSKQLYNALFKIGFVTTGDSDLAPSHYALRDTTIKGILKQLKTIKMGICSNGLETDDIIEMQKQNLGTPMTWHATGDEQGACKADLLLKAAESKGLTTKRFGSRRLLVLIDDKDSALDEAKSWRLKKTRTLLIHWQRPQTSNQITIDPEMLDYALKPLTEFLHKLNETGD